MHNFSNLISKNYFYVIILTIILLISTFVRFYNISITAPSLNWDEAALGYNAYALGIDGKDEFGVFLPYKFLESYGDFKPVVYSYLGIIPIKIFGLNELGVRFPSAFFGVLTVLLTYFLVKEIFIKKVNKDQIEVIALISAFILALSPWHIMLSRAAYEANISTFFIVLGVYLFLKAINWNSWLLILSAISFVITFYTFNTARVFVPLLVIALGIGFRKQLLQNKKQTLTSFIVGFLLILPILSFLFSPQAKLRFNEVNIFSNPEIILLSNKYIENDNNSVVSKLIHNRRILYGLEFAKHYVDNLNPRFLFISGDVNPRFSTQDVGLLYLIELPFLIAGLFLLFKKKEGYYWIIPVWLILGIIPAATARETPHALRIETVIPTLQIIVAYGFTMLLFNLKKYKKLISIGFIFLVIINFLYFYNGLIKHYAREYSSEWQYPYEQIINYIKPVKENYNQIIVSEALGRPYIYFLLYGKVNPNDFRSNNKIEKEIFGFVHVKGFDNYVFVREIKPSDLKKGNLYVDSFDKVPLEAKIIKKFYYLDGKEIINIYETN